jgi:hypothetical protein
MDKVDLTHAKDILHHVTPGPWTTDDSGYWDELASLRIKDRLIGPDGLEVVGRDYGFATGDRSWEECSANAEFCAYARTALPAMTERLLELENLARVTELMEVVIELDKADVPAKGRDDHGEYDMTLGDRVAWLAARRAP